jgi:hypothetical protein
MTAMSSAFHNARRLTKREKAAIKHQPIPSTDQRKLIFRQASINACLPPEPAAPHRDKGMDDFLCRQARPINVAPLPGKRTRAFAKTSSVHPVLADAINGATNLNLTKHYALTKPRKSRQKPRQTIKPDYSGLLTISRHATILHRHRGLLGDRIERVAPLIQIMTTW